MNSTIYFFLNMFLMAYYIVVGMEHGDVALFFIITLVLSVLYLRKTINGNSSLYLLSPCSLTFFYSIANFLLGSFLFYEGFYPDSINYNDLLTIEKSELSIYICFLNFCNMIPCFLMNFYGKSFTDNFTMDFQSADESTGVSQKKFNTKFAIFLMVIFLLLLTVNIGLSFLGARTLEKGEGGAGNFNYPFIFASIILLCRELKIGDVRLKYRFVIYAVILGIMVLISVESKREAFFVLIAIAMTELTYEDRPFILNLKSIIASITLVFVSVIVIIASSIMRGYGSYDVDNFTDAIINVPDYVESDAFRQYGANNFELTYNYTSAVRALKLSDEGKIETLYGETYLKALFVPIPRSVLGWKPRSMTDVFTSTVDPSFRAEGGSYPVSVYSEMFCNFKYFSLLILTFFFFIMQRLFLGIKTSLRGNEIRNLCLISFFSYFLMFVRGSGLDLLLVYTGITSVVLFLLNRFREIMFKN